MGRKCKRHRRSAVPVDIIACVSYIDTIVLILARGLPPELFVQLMDALAPNGKSGLCTKCVPTKRYRPDGTWVYTLSIHQPTEEALRIIELALQAPIHARIHEVHIALDLLTASRAEAVELQGFMARHLLPSSRPTKSIVWVKGTAYYNKGTRRGREWALYADLPSKVTGTWCSHIEIRIKGADQLRRDSLSSAAELLRLDHHDFWDWAIDLRRPPSEEQLALACERRRLKQDRRGAESSHVVTHRVLGSAHGDASSLAASDVLLALRRSRIEFSDQPTQLFSRQPHHWMLPARRNALWKVLREATATERPGSTCFSLNEDEQAGPCTYS
jgi:hypothetical protein